MNRYSISMSLRPNGQNTLRERPLEKSATSSRATQAEARPAVGFRSPASRPQTRSNVASVTDVDPLNVSNVTGIPDAATNVNGILNAQKWDSNNLTFSFPALASA